MLPPQQREIGFVFQDYALFDNMTVEENLLFVNDDKVLAKRLLEMTELTQLANRNAKGLSGGQKQRVSLCRAMMKKPKLLLMDEPLSALDPTMRTKLKDEILYLHKTFGTTTIMVSHDLDVSYQLADRILLLKQGKIIADGSPQKLFKKSLTETYTLDI
jgi:molybdate transport system ATP-binding protein